MKNTIETKQAIVDAAKAIYDADVFSTELLSRMVVAIEKALEEKTGLPCQITLSF